MITHYAVHVGNPGDGDLLESVAAYAVVLASMTTLLSNVPAVQIAGQTVRAQCASRLSQPRSSWRG